MNLGHGGNVEEISRLYKIDESQIIDFSANINPLGLNEAVKNAMMKALDHIQRYPDITYYELKQSISNYELINPNHLVLGNGAAEVIFNVTRALKPKKALLYTPTFSEYEDALQAVDCDIEYYQLKSDFVLDEAFIEEITTETDIVFICNPNNPTGVLTSLAYLVTLLNKAKETQTTVVVDESFLDFIEDKQQYSAIELTNDFDHLIVVKSLTKFFAFPGIRIGYGITQNEAFLTQLNKISVPWTVNTVAAAGAVAALQQRDYMSESMKYVQQEKEFLNEALNQFKCLTVYVGAVNFIFFKYHGELDLKLALLKHGILIRNCDNYTLLSKGYYRVAVRTHDENLKLIDALGQVL